MKVTVIPDGPRRAMHVAEFERRGDTYLMGKHLAGTGYAEFYISDDPQMSGHPLVTAHRSPDDRYPPSVNWSGTHGFPETALAMSALLECGARWASGEDLFSVEDNT